MGGGWLSGHSCTSRIGLWQPPGSARGLPSAPRFAFEVEAPAALHQPVEDGVGDGRVAQPSVPVLDGELVRDDGGVLGAAVVDDLQQVGARRGIDGAGSP